MSEFYQLGAQCNSDRDQKPLDFLEISVKSFIYNFQRSKFSYRRKIFSQSAVLYNKNAYIETCLCANVVVA